MIFDFSFLSAVVAIALATVAGVMSAQFPVETNPWVPPVVAGITALAALIRRKLDPANGAA